jgi:ligand-binding SRPBCC domain-containing protein
LSVIDLTTRIHAPREVCFDLARSLEFHIVTAGKTHEKVVGGRTSGLIGLNETVTWRAKHLGVWQHLTVQITAFDRPRYFQDAMLKGAFKSMKHDHHFETVDGATVMRDRFVFESPWGPLGALANKVFLEDYLRRFLKERAHILKSTAESDRWRAFI